MELKSKTSIEGKEHEGRELKDAYSSNLNKSEEVNINDLTTKIAPQKKTKWQDDIKMPQTSLEQSLSVKGNLHHWKHCR